MKNLADELHRLFNNLKRVTYPFENQLTLMPGNGIYVKFEKGERFGDFDRIVRVGTDTGENNLRMMLTTFFLAP